MMDLLDIKFTRFFSSSGSQAVSKRHHPVCISKFNSWIGYHLTIGMVVKRGRNWIGEGTD